MLPPHQPDTNHQALPVELGSLQQALRTIGALNAILDSSHGASIATDEGGVIQLFNLAAERLLGYSSDEVLGKLTLAEITDPGVVAVRARRLSLGTTMASFEALALKASRGIQDRSELVFVCKDSKRISAMVSIHVLLDERHQVVGHALIGTEKSERPSAPRFEPRARIEENLGALLTIDANGIITDINKQMESLTGCTREELIGAPFKNWFTEPGRAEASLEAVLQTGTTTQCELTARGRGGQEKFVSLRASPFRVRDQQRQTVCAVARLR